MITEKDIRPIPKYILKAIMKKDKQFYPTPVGANRFYAYLAVWKKELVKVTVAVKQHNRKWYCKQVAVHGLRSERCLVKDLEYCYLMGMGFRVGWYDEGIQHYRKFFESSHWWTANDDAYDPYALIINPAFVYKFPEYKYSAYDLYKGVDVLQYLRIYEQYPQVEYLMKLGFSDYIHSKQILRECAKNKAFCKWLVQNKNEIAHHRYYVSTLLSAYKSKRACNVVQQIEKVKKEFTANKDFKAMREFFKGNLEKFSLYIFEQNTTLRSYKDYFNACQELGLDMSLDKNCYPHDFKRWHDIRIDEYASKKAELDEKKREKFYKQFADVANKYTSLQLIGKKDFACLIAKSPTELAKEGDHLHHCVGRMGYDQKFVREETLIFFIRLNSDVTTPFVTVEYSLSQKAVLQCHSLNNTRPEEKVWKFVHDKWLPYANKQLKKIAA
jgi:hypothetical protein